MIDVKAKQGPSRGADRAKTARRIDKSLLAPASAEGRPSVLRRGRGRGRGPGGGRVCRKSGHGQPRRRSMRERMGNTKVANEAARSGGMGVVSV